MIRLVTRGRFTQDYAKALVAAPEDREPAVRKLIEGAGGKFVSFYFTTGDSDFMVISEGNDAESIIAALLETESSGMITVTRQQLPPASILTSEIPTSQPGSPRTAARAFLMSSSRLYAGLRHRGQLAVCANGER